MDWVSLNIFQSALVLAWNFKSLSRNATKLIILPMTGFVDGSIHPD